MAHPRYAAHQLFEIPLAEFLNQTLVQLQEESISIGINWSGEKLKGYDVSVSDVRSNIEYWAKLAHS